MATRQPPEEPDHTEPSVISPPSAAPSPQDSKGVTTPPEGIAERTGKRTAALSQEPNALKRFLHLLGPGLITGAADDDPAGIATFASAGASMGYTPLWTALLTFPMMAAVQYTCTKIGLVTNLGLAAVLRQRYLRKILYPALLFLVVANTVTAAADLGAIAAAINLIVPIPVHILIVPFTVAILALMIWGSYRLVADIFKWLTLALFAYIGAAFFANPDLGQVLRNTFIPTIRFDTAFLAIMVAILGTTISPYLFFWQASQEVEEQTTTNKKAVAARRETRLRQRRSPNGPLWRAGAAKTTELKYAAWDVNIGMFFSNVVVYFIILTAAATLFQNGRTDVQSATDLAVALRPLAGDAASLLLALGLIGTGLLAVPVLVGSSAYAISEANGWRYGLDRKVERAPQFYGVIAVSMLIALAFNFFNVNPIHALVWASVINGLLAPPILVLIMLVANNRSVMGNRVNGHLANIVGWGTTIAMFASAIGLIITFGLGAAG